MIVKNVTEIKNRITISAGESVKIQKKIVCAKKIIFGILQHVVLMDDYWRFSCYVWWNYRRNKSYSNKKCFNKNRSNKMYLNKFLHLTRLFINCHRTIDSCKYLLLFNKISGKTKTFTALLLHHYRIKKSGY